MSVFRTQLPPFSASFSISHADKIVSVGSCFAQHLGCRLESLLFPIEVNPFGILYNPISLGRGLQQLQQGYVFSEADIFQQGGRWVSYYHHSVFSAPDSSALLSQVNERSVELQQHLLSAKVLMVTLGTAFVFRHRQRGEVVANCHKLPASAFERWRLSVAEAVKALQEAVHPLLDQNPDLQVLLTVSPVRHLRDGLVDNQRSKATLLLAVDELVRSSERVHYFPAYELLIDDLRDYRFFTEDMAHPTSQAIEYVWDYFSNAFFSKATQQLNTRIEQLRKAMAHRPFAPESLEHQRFREKQLAKVESLAGEYPDLEWGELLAFFGGG
jgi:hypothetical protein